MTVTLPDELRVDAERQARDAGFATIDEYVAFLVMSDRDEPPVELPDSDGCIRTAEELRAAIDAGRRSPPVASVEEFFDDLRRIAAGGER
jgi:hypothetical protein